MKYIIYDFLFFLAEILDMMAEIRKQQRPSLSKKIITYWY